MTRLNVADETFMLTIMLTHTNYPIYHTKSSPPLTLGSRAGGGVGGAVSEVGVEGGYGG